MFPSFHFVFYCDSGQRNLFLGTVTGLSLVCSLVVILEFFAANKWQSFRAGLFVVLGCSAALPISLFSIEQITWHAAQEEWLRSPSSQMPEPATTPYDADTYYKWLKEFGAMAWCYLVGALLYALNCPEKCAVGRFDIIGHSHGIFHMFVVAGVVMTHTSFNTMLDAVEAGGFGEEFCAKRGEYQNLAKQLAWAGNGTA